jgi:hypothetical protein
MDTRQSAPEAAADEAAADEAAADIAVIIQVDLVHIAQLLSGGPTAPPAAAKQRGRAARRVP